MSQLTIFNCVWTFPGLNSTKQRKRCLAEDTTALSTVRLEPATSQSHV